MKPCAFLVISGSMLLISISGFACGGDRGNPADVPEGDSWVAADTVFTPEEVRAECISETRCAGDVDCPPGERCDGRLNSCRKLFCSREGERCATESEDDVAHGGSFFCEDGLSCSHSCGHICTKGPEFESKSPGDLCDGDSDCGSGMVCLELACPWFCVLEGAGQLGSPCDDDAVCATDLNCRNSECAVVGQLGSECDGDRPCASGLRCQASVCVVDVPPCVANDTQYGVRWCQSELSIAISTVVPEEVEWSELAGLVGSAFDTWANVAGCAVPRVSVVGTTVARTITTPTSLTDDPSNLIVFIRNSADWNSLPGSSASQIALTFIAFDRETGRIIDADIAVNDAAFLFTTADDASTGIDLLSTLTHEAGHFLGMADSDVVGATMNANYASASGQRLGARDLAQDDIDGICSIYD